VKEFFVSTIPPGGREKDNRKRIVNRKERITDRLVSNGEGFSKELSYVVRINRFWEFPVGNGFGNREW